MGSVALSENKKAGQNGNHTNTWVEILEEVAQKSGGALKTSASKVGDFTTHAAHLAKLKMEAHRLNNELCKLILEMGHKVWNLHKAQNLHQVEDVFSEDFQKIASIEKKLEENQTQLES